MDLKALAEQGRQQNAKNIKGEANKEKAREQKAAAKEEAKKGKLAKELKRRANEDLGQGSSADELGLYFDDGEELGEAGYTSDHKNQAAAMVYGVPAQLLEKELGGVKPREVEVIARKEFDTLLQKEEWAERTATGTGRSS